jgi:hypothetical protein
MPGGGGPMGGPPPGPVGPMGIPAHVPNAGALAQAGAGPGGPPGMAVGGGP